MNAVMLVSQCVFITDFHCLRHSHWKSDIYDSDVVLLKVKVLRMWQLWRITTRLARIWFFTKCSISWIPTYIQESNQLLLWGVLFLFFYHVAKLFVQTLSWNRQCKVHSHLHLAPCSCSWSTEEHKAAFPCRWADSITHLCLSVDLQSVSLWL